MMKSGLPDASPFVPRAMKIFSKWVALPNLPMGSLHNIANLARQGHSAKEQIRRTSEPCVPVTSQSNCTKDDKNGDKEGGLLQGSWELIGSLQHLRACGAERVQELFQST